MFIAVIFLLPTNNGKEQFKKSHMIASIKEYFVGVLALLSQLQAHSNGFKANIKMHYV